MPQQSDGLMRGFQLWINLPAAEKMSDPAYQEFQPEAFPIVAIAGGKIKVIMGDYDGRQGPISDPNTGVQYLDVSLEPGQEFHHDIAADLTAFLYVFEGAADVAGTTLNTHNLAVLDAGDSLVLRAGGQGARFILVTGRPLHEAIVQYGPFVMSSREEIEQALADYRDGKLVSKKAQFVDA